MPIRLNVVLSQPAAGDRRDHALADDVVAQLLGRPAIDVALIGPLGSVAPTDQLMLDGLTGDFAILAWSDPATTIDRLQQLGVAGRRGAHRDDPQVPQGSGRRIYCLDGRSYGSAAAVIDALAALLKDRQVVTFGLGGPAAGGAAAAARPAPPSAPPPATTLPAKPSSTAAAAASSPSPEPTTAGGGNGQVDRPRQVPGDVVPRRQRSDGEPTDALDALVDDLNALDL